MRAGIKNDVRGVWLAVFGEEAGDAARSDIAEELARNEGEVGGGASSAWWLRPIGPEKIF